MALTGADRPSGQPRTVAPESQRSLVPADRGARSRSPARPAADARWSARERPNQGRSVITNPRTEPAFAPGPRRPGSRRRPSVASSTAAFVRYDDPDQVTERVTVAGLLAGYIGSTRVSYTTDLHLFADWCADRGVGLLDVKHAHLGLYAQHLEASGRLRRSPAAAGEPSGRRVGPDPGAPSATGCPPPVATQSPGSGTAPATPSGSPPATPLAPEPPRRPCRRRCRASTAADSAEHRPVVVTD
jgi:hypothetical protein